MSFPPRWQCGELAAASDENSRRTAKCSSSLACHKIGDAGNAGPGQNLTHIGAQLSSQQIEHALFSPHEPMPSFKHLPAEKLHDLVRFLSLLRASSV